MFDKTLKTFSNLSYNMMETFYISLLGFIVLQHNGDLLYFIIRLYCLTMETFYISLLGFIVLRHDGDL